MQDPRQRPSPASLPRQELISERLIQAIAWSYSSSSHATLAHAPRPPGRRAHCSTFVPSHSDLGRAQGRCCSLCWDCNQGCTLSAPQGGLGTIAATPGAAMDIVTVPGMCQGSAPAEQRGPTTPTYIPGEPARSRRRTRPIAPGPRQTTRSSPGKGKAQPQTKTANGAYGPVAPAMLIQWGVSSPRPSGVTLQPG
jgi:hypothetical protein